MDPSASASTPVTVADQTIAQQLAARESENQLLKEEFNTQRAKMKELYLQKEEEVKIAVEEKHKFQNELEATRERLINLEDDNTTHKNEIESLRQLVQETVEESSNASNAEIKRLQVKCAEYEQQINLLNRQSNASPDKLLAPSAIVQAVTKRIARKLGTDPNSQDSLEDSMKKAQEDADVLRSLVVPLEEEITSLKEKLRDTDTQLQQANQMLESKSKSSKSIDSNNISRENLAESVCDMCLNYEQQLVSEQKKTQDNIERANKSDASLKMALEELGKEAKLRAEALAEWMTVRDEIRLQSNNLMERLTNSEYDFANAKIEMKNSHTMLLDEITRLTVDRETLQEQLDSLQNENERLLGKYSACAEMLRTEEIDLPNNIPDLQEYALKQREELIISVMGLERARESEQTLALLQRHAEELGAHNENLKIINAKLGNELDNFAEERAQIEIIKEQARTSYLQLQEIKEKKERLEEKVNEYRGRISSLQQDLNTSETVQKDFVRLSQTLQVQLERIRGTDVEVRWQHDEDVDECSNCHANFSTSKKKQHCRHCGRIFCNSCLLHFVSSGPRGRPAHVCDVCYTLLVKETAPYFSTEVPHTPD